MNSMNQVCCSNYRAKRRTNPSLSHYLQRPLYLRIRFFPFQSIRIATWNRKAQIMWASKGCFLARHCDVCHEEHLHRNLSLVQRSRAVSVSRSCSLDPTLSPVHVYVHYASTCVAKGGFSYQLMIIIPAELISSELEGSHTILVSARLELQRLTTCLLLKHLGNNKITCLGRENNQGASCCCIQDGFAQFVTETIPLMKTHYGCVLFVSVFVCLIKTKLSSTWHG